MIKGSDTTRDGKCGGGGDAPDSAMILAAGRGERMRPLTDDRPKPLLDAGGLPLIGWQLHALARAGVHRIVVNLGWLGEQIRESVGAGGAYGLAVTYTDEGYPPLETGGGIFNALPLLGDGPFLVANGDVWTDLPLERLRCPRGSLAHLVLVPNPPHNPAGDFRLEAGIVAPRGPGALTFSGIGIYRAGLFDGCSPGRFPLAPVLETAIRGGRVTGELYTGMWMDVGEPGRLERLRQTLQDRPLPRPGRVP